jgi:hypothetical protein
MAVRKLSLKWPMAKARMFRPVAETHEIDSLCQSLFSDSLIRKYHRTLGQWSNTLLSNDDVKEKHKIRDSNIVSNVSCCINGSMPSMTLTTCSTNVL